MKIGVTSKNGLKVGSVEKAYSFMSPVTIIGYSADSGVGEQPVGEQTILGARNRISDVKSRIPDLDRIVSIENGIFLEGNDWLDKAVVVIYDPRNDAEHIGYSDAVVFPTEYVERTRKIGFDTMTVSQVMAEAGFVANQKDPHLTISGISRQVYLENTVQALVDKIERAK